MKGMTGVVVAAAICANACPAQSQIVDKAQNHVAEKKKHHRFFVGIAATHLAFSEHSRITVNGTTDPAAQQRMTNNVGGLLQLGYQINPHFAAVVAVGTPQTTTERATGSIAAAGELGRVQFVPVVANILYLLPKVGRVHPFVGGGFSYSIVTRSRGSFLQNFRAGDSFGPELIAGTEVSITPRVAVNAFYSKTFFSSLVKFNLPPSFGSPAGTNHLRLDPTMVGVGLKFRI